MKNILTCLMIINLLYGGVETKTNNRTKTEIEQLMNEVSLEEITEILAVKRSAEVVSF